MNISVKNWPIPVENGPKGCKNWKFCKGLENNRNEKNSIDGRARRFKSHVSEENCPYKLYLVNLYLNFFVKIKFINKK